MPGIRLVAGPNGSGKTTLTRQLREKHAVPLGQYLNPDDIAKHIDFQSIIDNLPPEKAEESAAILARNISIGLRNDWIRDYLSFTYESVMSHKSHVDFVQQAKNKGYKAYLYYVCTSDVDLNKERVHQRVAEGGHNVPEAKIRSRYERSLTYLKDMLALCHRAYLFDNSKEMTFIAEVTPDGFLDIVEEAFDRTQPHWFVDSILRAWPSSKIRLGKV